ncbi:hypothetical protein [Candidatus Chromulinivorax destructor]|uniref:Right handed beta helix domain-containing protein n=1 Tax=Candidatus Chromulinivorax destructor TaxID=2066483 RepID=A0A345ZAK6_9BACT|nr:hypothetical protein [Candidatus Chromulinivorax destructor]AXK60323.1 hypothetical protein C0J27_00975 [Candidatus Chromulinivorax destructor]
MKKILTLLLLISLPVYAREEHENSLDFLDETNSDLSNEYRVTQVASTKQIPLVNFSKPLVFNPNNTPSPAQPAQITDIKNLLVYITGTHENGPFGSSKNAITQINAINNNNIGFVNVMNLINLQNLIANQINNNQGNGPNTINQNAVIQNSLVQGAAQQSASTQSASAQGGVTGTSAIQLSINPINRPSNNQITNQNNNQNNGQNNSTNIAQVTNQIGNNFANLAPNQIIHQMASQSANFNQIVSPTPQQLAAQLISQTNAISAAGIASSALNGNNFGGLMNTNSLNQISSPQASMASSTQALTQSGNNSTQTPAQSVTHFTQTSSVTNPNPFITLNNPVLTPKSVVWNSPLIINESNHFFDTQSVVKFEENVVFNPGSTYTFPADYVNYPAAIIIGKSNITIDLNGFNLSLDPKSASNFAVNRPIHGISIMPGVQNIKIISSTEKGQTGTISNFSGYGIYGNGFSTQFNAATAQTTYNIHESLIQNIFIENILIYGNLGGISLTNVLQIIINFVAVSYSFGNQDVYGIVFNKVFNGAITNSKINQNYSNKDVFGIAFIDTISTSITNSLIDNNRSVLQNVTGVLIRSSTLSLSRNNKVDSCNIVGNTCANVTGMQVIGINIIGTVNNTIGNCTVATNFYGPSLNPPATSAETYGIKLDGTFQNSIADNTVAYHGTCGIIDTATLSSSLFIRNVAIMNEINYSAQVQDGVTVGGIPLPTTIVYPGNLTAYTGSGPLWQNIDVRLTP